MTPMMQQYHHIKEQYQECLLLFRMGDFYELFFEDAVTAAKCLDIALTRRGKHQDEDIPMCGVPYHAADAYLARLVKAGHKVALCDQVEDPTLAKKRGPKSIVKRDVVRVITPGTLTEDHLLDARHHNFLALCYQEQRSLSLAVIDISTGDFFVENIQNNNLILTLTRLNPSEVIIPENLLNDPVFAQEEEWRKRLTVLPNSRFDRANAEKRLNDHFQVKTLEGFGHFTAADVIALNSLMDYVTLTQKNGIRLIKPPFSRSPHDILEIDAATQRNLELMCCLDGKSEGSLIFAIDRTITPMGGRLLRMRLSHPSTSIERIQERLSAITFFQNHQDLEENIRHILKACPDGERALSRLSYHRGGPRDLAAIRDLLKSALSIRQVLSLQRESVNIIETYRMSVMAADFLLQTLEQSLQESLPSLAREGDFIQNGYCPTLDELRLLKDNGKQLILNLQMRYVQELNIPSLKIKHNNIIGYHIEVTSTHLDKIPDFFIHRQSIVNGMRYATIELNELEQKLLHAAETTLNLELEIYQTLVQSVLSQSKEILKTTRSIAAFDVATSLSFLAREEKYCCPVVDSSLNFCIKKGRHPVVEQSLKKRNDVPFVANDCTLEKQQRLWLLTGPNMAGKSTFLRQNALMAILAQMGSYVPAESAHIGVLDRLFSRVGAADNLARGQSTFMVEMIETALILNLATPKSLVILDEVGRGTSTYDGLSIAWATIEDLHNHKKCRCLFATHYHELTQLRDQLDSLYCATVAVKEWENQIVFLHHVMSGIADRSYGIHVAKLAGIPAHVSSRAEEILRQLEGKERPVVTRDCHKSLPLFSPLEEPRQINVYEEKLNTLDLDNMTPRQAMDILYAWKKDTLRTREPS